MNRNRRTSQPMEILLRSTKERVFWTLFGLFCAWTAGINLIVWHEPIPGLYLAWGACVCLTLGMCRGFPAWSHVFTPAWLRKAISLLLVGLPIKESIKWRGIVVRLWWVTCAAAVAHVYFRTIEAAPLGMLAGLIVVVVVDGVRQLFRRQR